MACSTCGSSSQENLIFPRPAIVFPDCFVTKEQVEQVLQNFLNLKTNQDFSNFTLQGLNKRIGELYSMINTQNYCLYEL